VGVLAEELHPAGDEVGARVRRRSGQRAERAPGPLEQLRPQSRTSTPASRAVTVATSARLVRSRTGLWNGSTWKRSPSAVTACTTAAGSSTSPLAAGGIARQARKIAGVNIQQFMLM